MDSMPLTGAPPTNPPQNAKVNFDNHNFSQLLESYNNQSTLPYTLDLTQAFLMTSNLTAAANTQLANAQYENVVDYVTNAESLAGSMLHFSKVVQQLGPADRSSNFIIAQKQLMQAQSKQDTELRSAISAEIVDGLEYARAREQICLAKQRVQGLLDLSEDSDESKSDNEDHETAQNSQELLKRSKLTQKRLHYIVKSLRQEAVNHLGQEIDSKKAPLSFLFRKLKHNKQFLKRRQLKEVQKDANTQHALNEEFKSINSEINQIAGEKGQNPKKLIVALKNKIAQIKQVLGLQQRINAKEENKLQISPAEIDQKPTTSNSLAILNLLLKKAGQQGQKNLKSSKSIENIFGRFKKLPSQSNLLQGFQKESPQQEKLQTQEIVKVIGLEPEQLFKSLGKYKIDASKIPTFSNIFDSYETFIPGAQVTQTAAPVTHAQNIADKQSYARLDGRNVISLAFNPYHLDTVPKQKLYQAVMTDFVENRTQALKSLSAALREKQESAAIKRVWTQIAKRDIPKAYRALQKHNQDAQTLTQKLASGAQRELRKKMLKAQRLVKESQLRCKKLTKDVMSFWKKRDRELADLKRKKEKFDKEMRKKQQEEEEQLLQKKRLEYLMKQSEIYAHFMANKMGMGGEQKQEDQLQMEAEAEIGIGRVAVDEASARRKMAKMINEDREKLKDFDGSEASMVNEDDLDVNRFDTDNQMQKPIETPQMLNAKLKEYQLRGLRWLDNLYEQGINGILADEMGLGKTIQAISLMAHIAETKGVWGPFLVVVPVTTLHNWQNELRKFCPQLKILPYFGNQEERKKLSKFLDPKNMMNPALQIHVVITSYNLIVNNPKDQAKLLKIKWNYMILDEAQAIKNNASRRWKVLLQFQTRNRLLLTGTPIQNSMAELWALLHFIMPKLFDNHEQFQEWFSKDIEASSLNQGELNKIQLKRLHAVLKPFMLRRLKKDVEQEIAPKTEIVLHCDMTYRQRVLYQRIRSKISYKDLHSLSENKAKIENLMNLVMHMRKVCNHPDLFESRDVRIPVAFRELQIGVQPNLLLSNNPDVRPQMTNPISYNVPKLIFDELTLISDSCSDTYKHLLKGEDISFSRVSRETHSSLFNIFNASFVHTEMLTSHSQFGIFRLLAKSNCFSVSEIVYILNSDPLLSAVSLAHHLTQMHIRRTYWYIHQNESENIEIPYYGGQPQKLKDNLSIQIIDMLNQDTGSSVLYREIPIVSVVDNSLDVVQPLICVDPIDRRFYAHELTNNYTRGEIENFYLPKCTADPIVFQCPSSGTFNRFITSLKQNPNAKRTLLGPSIKFQKLSSVQKCQTNQDGTLNYQGAQLIHPLSKIRLPNPKALIQDCAKMQAFAKLIPQLAAQKHRCLVFCQMTRMLDLLEDFLLTQHLSYFRLDGSTTLQDRRFMVDEYQNNPNIFAFLLSTRAGGLGINLIAADTVIFYDNDWNPTMDEQATDRAHRIGQTKPVTIYRLVTRGTVEEKIVRRAQQKQNVQSTVYGDSFKVKDVQLMLAEGDDGPEQQQGFIKSRKRGKKPTPGSVKPSVKKGKTPAQEEPEDQEMEEEFSNSESDSEGVVVQMDVNEGGEANKPVNIEDGGDDEDMIDDY